MCKLRREIDSDSPGWGNTVPCLYCIFFYVIDSYLYVKINGCVKGFPRDLFEAFALILFRLLSFLTMSSISMAF